MPSARFQHHATAVTDIETAWKWLQKPETWGGMTGVTDISNVARSGSGSLTSFEFVAVVGGRPHSGLATTIGADQPRAMSIRIQSNELDGTVAIVLTSPSEVEVLVAADLELNAKGFLASMFFSVITGVVGSGFPEQVEAFAARLAAP